MIPVDFAPLFWSYRITDLDVKRHQRTIVTQLINYGDLRHWHWLLEQYGREGLRSILADIPKSALRSRAARLATIVFDTERVAHASRSAH